MPETSQPVGSALSHIAGAWRDIAQSASRTLGLSNSETLVDKKSLKKMMESCLNGRGGEVSARMRTAELGQAYLEMDEEGRKLFITLLAKDFCASEELIKQAISEFESSRNEAERVIAAYHLRQAAMPGRLQLLTQFNALPNGVKFLVDLRNDLLGFKGKDPYLEALDQDLQQLLSSWFDPGFLDLVEMTWNTSAALLEKLIAYEAVHQITSWGDLKNRLDSDRRCYALFHPRMPDEPLAFVEVALVKGIARNVQDILDVEAPLGNSRDADTAIFYSITNTQTGLRGISFGEQLIKQVVQHLSHEMPWIKRFATLSPVPAFRSWLADLGKEFFRDAVTSEEMANLKKKTGAEEAKTAIFLCFQDKEWFENPELAELLSGPLMRLCVAYFLEKDAKGRALDPVARFHLKNGAQLNQINWLGDTSEKGIAQAAGMMVNYSYDLAEIEKNHEGFMNDGTVAMSARVRSHLKQLGGALGEETTLQRLRRSIIGGPRAEASSK
ncbi:malonyl-CoA decarboxylase [Kiloniella laminariae]|uniref:Malonyl-CoA decarboxylase n=2 Tax=Kiloniella laminariae TaxID=454162 RepID=A0ABT4LGB4_9PROT|nr:malonyl-CoA decarboxylase [Kiloniella laminariae]